MSEIKPPAQYPISNKRVPIFTLEDIDKIVQLQGNGLSVANIRKEMGRGSISTIKGILRNRGLRAKSGRQWTPVEIETLLIRWSEGLSAKEISREYLPHRTYTTLGSTLSDLRRGYTSRSMQNIVNMLPINPVYENYIRRGPHQPLQTKLINYSWQRVGAACNAIYARMLERELAQEIKYIIAINRGGWIPATILAHKLGVKQIRASTELLPEADMKRSLLVDDICDTGQTLKQEMAEGWPISATLILKANNAPQEYWPTIWGEEIGSPRWVRFPWEEEGEPK